MRLDLIVALAIAAGYASGIAVYSVMLGNPIDAAWFAGVAIACALIVLGHKG